MKTAVISDIHGNLPALEAVLADARSNAVDQYAFLGDYIFDFPWPNQVVRAIRALPNAFCVSGNKEERLPDIEREDQSAWTDDQFANVHQTFRELDPDVLAWLKALPREMYLPLGGGKTAYLAHFPYEMSALVRRDGLSSYSCFLRAECEPVSHDLLQARFAAALATEEYAAHFRKISADVILFGHNHLQFYGACGDQFVVDAGSCGLPVDFDSRAAYTIVESDASGLRVAERRVSYDIAALIREAKTSQIYARSPVWGELIFRTLIESRDYLATFLKFTADLAEREGRASSPFANDVWRRSYREFTAQLDAGAFIPRL